MASPIAALIHIFAINSGEYIYNIADNIETLWFFSFSYPIIFNILTEKYILMKAIRKILPVKRR